MPTRWRAVSKAVAKQGRYEVKKLVQETDMSKHRIFATWSTTADSSRIQLNDIYSRKYFD